MTRGAPFRCEVHLPPSFFCRNRASEFVWAPQAKKCTKSCKLTLKITFLLHFYVPPQTPCPVLNLGSQILDPPHPCHSSAKAGSPGMKTSWVQKRRGRGGLGQHSSVLLQGAKINASLAPGWATSWIRH